MRIEYWGRIRVKNGSYYVTIPSGEAYKLAHTQMVVGREQTDGDALAGLEVKVEVTL